MWLKTSMMRLHGRAPRGQRAIGRSPHGHWQTTMFLADLRLDRIVAPLVLDGPMDGMIFPAWFEQFLAQTSALGNNVLAYNLASHKVAGLPAAIETRGASMMVLPAFSSDLNPIEHSFAKLKAVTQRFPTRSRQAMFEAIGYAFHRVPLTECATYLAHPGYGQPA